MVKGLCLCAGKPGPLCQGNQIRLHKAAVYLLVYNCLVPVKIHGQQPPAGAQHAVQLPQYALLGSRLRERGIPLDSIPITEAQAVSVIGKALQKGGAADGVH